ncbi:MAG: NuoM family protein [Roseiflexaceae bacterium]|nr:NADH-quinone oxidoreductase subunit M [Chloroflexaceae bacterium]
MNQLGFPLVTLLIAVPFVAGLIVLLAPRHAYGLQRGIASIAAIANVVLAVIGLVSMAPVAGYQFVDSMAWFPAIGLKYAVGLDGINIWMVIIATLVMPLALFAARTQPHDRQRGFYALLMMLSASTIGAFVAIDLLLFYVFFELTLVPTAMLIAMYGVGERKAAAIKFFVYPFVGSIFLLVSIAGLVILTWQQTGVWSFDSVALAGALNSGAVTLDEQVTHLLFAGFFIAFAIKTPIWPFHTWMPQAQAATPDHGAVDIAGLLLKVGAFGFIRFALPFFPQSMSWAAPAVGILAIISIIYAGIVAFGQHDMKVLLSYATISHLGFVILGIFSQTVEGISGALLTMINSGLTTGALFVIVGILARNPGGRDPNSFGGVWASAPRFGTLALVVVFASIGVPGLNGFIGEFLSLQGAWLSPHLGFGYISGAVLGIVVSAAYLLRMFRTVFMGAVSATSPVAEASKSELAVLGVLVIAMVVIGLYPQLILQSMQPSITALVSGISQP